jgi:hypothetical protein
LRESVCSLGSVLGDEESYLPIGGKTELKYSKSSLQYGHSYVPFESLPRSTVLVHEGHSTSTILCSDIIWGIILDPTPTQTLAIPTRETPVASVPTRLTSHARVSVGHECRANC